MHGYFVEQMCLDDQDGWSQLNEKPILSKTYRATGLKSGYRYRFRISVATSKTDRMSGHDTHVLDIAGKINVKKVALSSSDTRRVIFDIVSSKTFS